MADATSDDRFARDPYFTDLDCCSLLAVPILSRGTLRAVLLLENRLIRGAFTAERLDAVKLIAGQLAVSLDNAQLYAEYRRIADEQAALRRVATLVARGRAAGAGVRRGGRGGRRALRRRLRGHDPVRAERGRDGDGRLGFGRTRPTSVGKPAATPWPSTYQATTAPPRDADRAALKKGAIGHPRTRTSAPWSASPIASRAVSGAP